MLCRKGSLTDVSELQGRSDRNLPNTLQVHRPNFHHVSDFLAFENAVSPPPSHAGNIEQLGAINHMIIWRTKISTTKLCFNFWGISYLLASQRTPPLPRLESKDFPRPPKELLSPWVSFLEVRPVRSDRIGGQADSHSHAPEHPHCPCTHAAREGLAS